MKPELSIMLGMAALNIIAILAIYSLVSTNVVIEPMVSIKAEYEQNNATGVYVPGCGYFVDTRGRDKKEIELTEAHEQVHEMIYQNQSCGRESCYNHFCGDKYN